MFWRMSRLCDVQAALVIRWFVICILAICRFSFGYPQIRYFLNAKKIIKGQNIDPSLSAVLLLAGYFGGTQPPLLEGRMRLKERSRGPNWKKWKKITFKFSSKTKNSFKNRQNVYDFFLNSLIFRCSRAVCLRPLHYVDLSIIQSFVFVQTWIHYIKRIAILLSYTFRSPRPVLLNRRDLGAFLSGLELFLKLQNLLNLTLIRCQFVN